MENKTLQLLRTEDPPTQKKVYYEHCDRLMGVVYRYLGSVADAEEVLQYVFLTIFTKIDDFDPEKGAFTSWTHRIAVNSALMFLRKKKRMVFAYEDLAALPATDYTVVPPHQMEQTDIDYYLARLPDKTAVVFRLKAVEGYNHQEIAEMLCIRSDASRAIYSRARKKLRKYLNAFSINYKNRKT